jgi:trans-2,3-dihydro-3-hydroxyanthranilate isomerase
MARRLLWKQVDVFADRPLSGSAVAVFLDGRSLDPLEMAAVAREINLPETTFVLPPTATEATYRIRSFVPGRERQFPSNSVLAAAFALAEEGAFQLFEPLTTVFEETSSGVLPIELEVSGGRPLRAGMTQTPPPVFGRVFGRPGSPTISALATALGVGPNDVIGRGLYPQVIDTGSLHLMVCIDDVTLLSSIKPDLSALGRISHQLAFEGFAVFAPQPLEPRAQVRIRYFSPGAPMPEEPATASAAAGVGAYLAKWSIIHPEKTGLARFIAEQGTEIERPSLIEVAVAVDSLDREVFTVRVSGDCFTSAAGELVLP